MVNEMARRRDKNVTITVVGDKIVNVTYKNILMSGTI